MRAQKDFRNQAKSGAKALPARWRQAAAKAKLEKQGRKRWAGKKSGQGASRGG
ncbi:MAG: hypothetical protein ACE5JI_14060 [Acidobacteriota bacterium]